jgi:hypothetical protein
MIYLLIGAVGSMLEVVYYIFFINLPDILNQKFHQDMLIMNLIIPELILDLFSMIIKRVIKTPN